MADSRASVGFNADGICEELAALCQLSLFAISIVVSCKLSTGSCNGLGTMEFASVGPIARSRTCLPPLPEITNPPIRTWLPVSTRARVEMFESLELLGSKAKPPAPIPEANVVLAPAGVKTKISEVPKFVAKTLPAGFTTICLGALKPTANGDATPAGLTLKIEPLAKSTSYRSPEGANAIPNGWWKPVANVVFTPAEVNFRIEFVFTSETKRFPEGSKTSPKGPLTPVANVVLDPLGAYLKIEPDAESAA